MEDNEWAEENFWGTLKHAALIISAWAKPEFSQFLSDSKVFYQLFN